MDREQFDHVLRAAAGVLGASQLIVIGSQAVHGSLRSGLPIAAARSVEGLTSCHSTTRMGRRQTW